MVASVLIDIATRFTVMSDDRQHNSNRPQASISSSRSTRSKSSRPEASKTNSEITQYG